MLPRMIFDFEILYGDPVQILSAPNKALISQSMAQKYFGKQAPVGKILRLDDKHDYEIAGVLADMPENSHIKMDLVIPWKNLEEQFGPEYYEAWGHSGTFTYLLLHKDANISDLKAKIADLVNSEFGEVFTPFTTADSDSGDGSMGLAIVREILHANRGTVTGRHLG